MLPDIYPAPFIPENCSGFRSCTQGSVYPALNETVLLTTHGVKPGYHQDKATQPNPD